MVVLYTGFILYKLHEEEEYDHVKYGAIVNNKACQI
jgi:hypothetical protein